MIALTEDLLIDAGGWQVLREARSIQFAGRVSGAKYEPPTLQGLVRGGSTEYHSGLRIISPTEIENLCTCPDSRRRNVICAHSIAVALEIMRPASLPPDKSPAGRTVESAKIEPFISPNHVGPSVELFVILPPNFLSSWEKNSLTVVVETLVHGQRKPFGALDVGKFYLGEPNDARCAEAFLSLTDRKPATMALLDRDQASAFLTILTGHPGVSFGKSTKATISEEGIRPALKLEHLPDCSLRLSVAVDQKKLMISKQALWFLDGTVLSPVSTGLPPAYFSIFKNPVVIPGTAAGNFLVQELPILAGYFDCTGLDIPKLPAPEPAEPKPRLHLKLEGSLNFLAGNFVGSGDIGRLKRCGFVESKGEMVLKGERNILTFFAVDLPILQRDWRVEIGERFEHVTREIERIEAKMEVRGSGEQWFDLAYDVRTPGGESFSPAEISRLLEAGQSYVKRPNGKIAVFDQTLLDDFSQLLRDVHPEQRQTGIYRLDKCHAGVLEAFAEEAGTEIGGPGDWKRWSGNPRRLEQMEPVPLGSLEEVLRPYQKHGVQWMHFLAENRFGGILADEMGLGKTLQTLAFLLTRKGRGTSLIVCPSSLIFNWKAEAQRWTPELRVLVLEGAKRAGDFADIDGHDVVITSYPLLRVDVEAHRAFIYSVVVLDEAQQIKNPDSQIAQCASALRAVNRFVLTGTPVENSVRDIWSLMHFLMPNYLGTRGEFKGRYEFCQVGSSEQLRLRRRIQPFLLRRTKEVVASELPEKLEQVAWCELSGPQREIYTRLATSARQQLSELSSSADQKRSRMIMLTALLRLRQAACDCRLLGMDNFPSDDEYSAKMSMLMELIEEAVDGEHRVLVFSQFVTMLSLIRDRLDAAGTPYCYLDGQSKDRAQQVQKFQVGETPVFLISLKAGGTGLNLTAADTVIHFDPWWNPAVEAQATDRAHRIGQKKVVTSYKLIARGTVEEKILTLQAKKKSMIAATLESEHPIMDGLTMREIEILLE